MSVTSSSGVVGPDNARRYANNGVDYPLRFFNLLHFERPKSLSEVYKWCIRLSESHGLFDRVIDTFARYPITHIAIGNDCGENKDWWSKLFNDTLNLPCELVSNGKDFYTFGNCITSIVPPFNRYLKCPKCGSYLKHNISDDNADERDFDWKYKDFKFYGKCKNDDFDGKKCNYSGEMEVKDEYIADAEEFASKVRIQRWPINHIKIRDLTIAGKKRIYYRLEDKYRKPIISGDRFVVANIPYTFILACKKSAKDPIILLPSDLTFHYKHESITEPDWEGLSKPYFFSAWKDIFMSFILRKAQECIASDHLIPNRFIFPTATPGGQDPLAKIDGAAWVSTITTQLKRQQNDPNEIGIVPFPLGYQALGGQGKAMSLREEIELQDRRILTQMGMPPELIYGGMTWSGSNISLRMLENIFLYYINMQNKFIAFLAGYIAHMTKRECPSSIKMLPFKMADDIQQMQTLLALGAQGRISETTALSQVGNGINLTSEADQAEKDKSAIERINKAKMLATAEASSAVNKVTSMETAENQASLQSETNDLNTRLSSAQQLVDGIMIQTVQGIVNKINSLKSKQEKEQVLLQLQSQDPAKFNEVIGALNGIIQEKQQSQLPQARPPRSSPENAKI